MTTVLAFRHPAKEGGTARAEASRYRVLKWLYARQAAIHDLICALERYQKAGGKGRSAVIPIDRGPGKRTAALRRRKAGARA